MEKAEIGIGPQINSRLHKIPQFKNIQIIVFDLYNTLIKINQKGSESYFRAIFNQTKNELNKRMSSHRSAIKEKEYLLIGEHFHGGGRCSLEHLKVQPIEQLCENSIKFRLERENFWIK